MAKPKKQRIHEERFLLKRELNDIRYEMPPRIDADPEEIARRIMDVRGYAKKQKSTSTR